jgi:hypothetical protein
VIKVKKPLEVVDRELVAVLVLAVVISVLLNGVVGKVNKLVGKIRNRELFAACPKVAVSVEVAFKASIYGGHQAIASYVEFASTDQQRLLYVLLNDECSLAL